MDIQGQLLALAARQHHCLTVRQAVELGMHPDTFRDLRRRQGWVRRHRGVWSPPGTDVEAAVGRLAALLLAAGSQAAATGLAGLWLRGLVEDVPDDHRLWVPRHAHAPRTLPARVLQDRHEVDVEPIRRLPTTSVAWSLLHWCRPPSPTIEQVRDLLAVLVQRRSATMADIEAVAELPRVPGAPLLRQAAADLAATGADSPLSLRVHRRLSRSGRRPDPRPATVTTRTGRVLHPDITFSAARVAIEADGVRHHTGGRALSLDQSKDRAYRSACWEPIRLTWWDLDHRWEAFLRHLDEQLAAQRAV